MDASQLRSILVMANPPGTGSKVTLAVVCTFCGNMACARRAWQKAPWKKHTRHEQPQLILPGFVPGPFSHAWDLKV